MKKLLLLFILIWTLSLTNCTKKGCTDPDSIHYDQRARADDGNCEYEGSLVFWYGKEVSEFLLHNNVDSLHFYLNEELIGSTEAKTYRTTAPNCNDFNNAVKTTKSLGEIKSVGYEFSVQSEEGIVIWNTSININGNTCSTLELGL